MYEERDPSFGHICSPAPLRSNSSCECSLARVHNRQIHKATPAEQKRREKPDCTKSCANGVARERAGVRHRLLALSRSAAARSDGRSDQQDRARGVPNRGSKALRATLSVPIAIVQSPVPERHCTDSERQWTTTDRAQEQHSE